MAYTKLAWNAEEGTIEQRERNPELNTKNFDMNERRLEKFSKSKYKKRIFYIGVDQWLLLLSHWKKNFLLMEEIS